MIPYPKRKDTPSRLTRKQARRNVFIKNRKESKLRRETKKQLRATVLEDA
jgi:hypothetical protein